MQQKIVSEAKEFQNRVFRTNQIFREIDNSKRCLSGGPIKFLMIFSRFLLNKKSRHIMNE